MIDYNKTRNFDEEMKKAENLHGHACPSLHFGVTISLVALDIAKQRHLSLKKFEMEGKTDCFRDGVKSVFGENVKFKELPLNGNTFIRLCDGNSSIKIEILKAVKQKVVEIKKEAGKEHFLSRGLEYLSTLQPEDYYKVS